ncbi:hypothetical protein Pan216_44840 [Planctomycetes bacterium Pan216]|uniref:DUF1598 domain-containing protein n=1 Tax=Kolteria novifilia TaxID=2527975 RepID=A0A518B9L1_9BACT|nr:hypothetical protein Pan216_44840 [Planctomycetes bacterium Pan216]
MASRFSKWTWAGAIVLALLSLFSEPTMAQVATTGAGGVFVDAQGVLRARQTADKARSRKLAALRKRRGRDAEVIAFVSLPRLFREVKGRVDAGEAIPEEMAFLDGMTRLQYVFVFPEEKDLVIAGPREPLDSPESGRAIGEQSGRPTLRLDDLVTALRTVGPGKENTNYGCSLDLPPNAIPRIQQAAGRIGAVRRGRGYGRVMQAIAQACGPQEVRFFGIDADTPTAFTMIEADYILKQLNLGLMRSPVSKVKSRFALLRRGESLYSRVWFTPDYDSLIVAPEGDAYELRGQGLRVLASDSPTGRSNSSGPSAEAFAKQFTEHFPEMEAAIPVLADLRNVTDLGVLAALIGTDRLHEKAEWDLRWILDPSGYPVPKTPVPTTAATLANAKLAGRSLLLSVGGVNLSPGRVVEQDRQEAPLADFPVKPSRPSEETQWSMLGE